VKNLSDIETKGNGKGGLHMFGAKPLNLFLLSLFTLVVIASACAFAIEESADDFYVKPYLQMGKSGKPDELELLWVAKSNRDRWQLEVKSGALDKWRPEATPAKSFVSTPHPSPLFRCRIKNLVSGEPFRYRLLKNGLESFEASGIALKKPGQSCRVILFGDMGANTEAQRKVAYRIFESKPDLLVFLGDITYDYGLYSEYLNKFFPIYNCEKASFEAGAPILRAIVAIAVLGNHDVALGDNPHGVNLDKFADGLAFFEIWSSPLNGPLSTSAESNIPRLIGTKASKLEYEKQAGERYPRMANYSFNYGDAHWLVLDANPYMDWTNESLRNWVAKDLAEATSAKWKFVCFHQPGFSFDVSHYKEQRMRLLCDVFEKGGVDIVFAGHAHNYQRSFPLRFQLSNKKEGSPINSDGTVDGAFAFDKQFDGHARSVPDGVIYIVSGAGGAKLYPSADTKDHNLKRTFTDKFISDTHSFTVLNVSNTELSVEQISENGNSLDSFKVTKVQSVRSAPVSQDTKKVLPAKSALPEVSGVNQ
jgi:predicted phosphodiesterase